MDRALRKERSALTLSGIGAMLLGIWAFVRIVCQESIQAIASALSVLHV